LTSGYSPGAARKFALLGVRGQAIYVDPAAKVVMVHTGEGRLDGPFEPSRETARHGRHEDLRGAARRQPLERLQVHLDRGRIEGQGVALDDEDRRLGRRQVPAQGNESLPEALPRLLVPAIAQSRLASLSRGCARSGGTARYAIRA